VLIEFAEQVEQQGTAAVAERQIAELIQDHEIGAHQIQRNAAGLAEQAETALEFSEAPRADTGRYESLHVQDSGEEIDHA
jgi:hypothetical protein